MLHLTIHFLNKNIKIAMKIKGGIGISLDFPITSSIMSMDFFIHK
jgi:hypothetical protein